MSLESEFDSSVAGQGDIFQDTYETPSVMIMGYPGPDWGDCGIGLTYRGCPKCSFEKINEDGTCGKCGGSEYEDPYLIRCTIGDPTDTVEGVLHHEAAKEFIADEELLLKPVAALAHLGPDNRNPGKHALELFAFKPMFTATGVLNVFRSPLARFSGSGDRVTPTRPNDVKTNSLSQTTVHDVFSTTVRFLLKIASTAPSTKVEDDVEGMRCEQTAQCCISAADVTLALAGSFDTVSPLYHLKKKEIVHVLCSPTAKSSDDGTPTFRPPWRFMQSTTKTYHP